MKWVYPFNLDLSIKLFPRNVMRCLPEGREREREREGERERERERENRDACSLSS